MKAALCHSGFALPLVLILTVIGALFGAGSLLLFKYQCHRRIDRQHELEKVYAVRSAANYAKASFSIGTQRIFDYKTCSGRDLSLLVKPVEDLFPVDSTHLDISSAVQQRHFNIQEGTDQYCKELDYEYGVFSNGVAITATTSQIYYKKAGRDYLTFSGVGAENGARWWVNIGMKNTGGWLQGDFGRRYLFRPNNWVYGKDYCMRLCIIRNKNGVGGEYGWPLGAGESALVLEMRPGLDSKSNGEMSLYAYENGLSNSTKIRSLACPNTCWMGLQIAGRNAYLFYVPNDIDDCGCVLSERWEMPDDAGSVYRALTASPAEGESSDILRAVVECESKSATSVSDLNSIQYFSVTPAYQYDVFLKAPEWNDYERATVIQKHGVLDIADCYPKKKDGSNPSNWNSVKYSIGFSLRSYDTHGTAWKGYKVRQ